jgi:hypothetical protein
MAAGLVLDFVLWQTVIEKAMDPRFGVRVFLGGDPVLKAYHVAIPYNCIAIPVVSAAMWFALWRTSGYRIALRCCLYSLCIASLMILPCVIW